MSIEKILETLEKQERMHRSLLELAHKKTDVLKANDMEQLSAILTTEQAHVAAIETLEQQRQQLVTEYFRAKGIQTADKPTVAQLIEAATTEEKPKLAATRERLLTVVDELKKSEFAQSKISNSIFTVCEFLIRHASATACHAVEYVQLFRGRSARRSNSWQKVIL